MDSSDIQWYFQSSVDEIVEIFNNTNKYILFPDRHSLTISDVQLSDVGTYGITAANVAGSNHTIVTLVVYGKLKHKLIVYEYSILPVYIYFKCTYMFIFIMFLVEAALQNKTGYSIEAMTGETIAFTCTADGINRPSIKWRKDGQLILNTTRRSIHSQNDTPGFRFLPGIQVITSLLTISDLKETDTGNYSCRADNEAKLPVSLDSPFMLIVSGTMPRSKYVYLLSNYLYFITVAPTINPCVNSLCQNGQCHDLSDDSYLCICYEGYTGINCDIGEKISKNSLLYN